MKILLWAIVVVVLIVGGFYFLNDYIYTEKQGDQRPAASEKDATYVIEGRVITLANGISELEAAPGSASKIVTRYFGNEVRKDLNGDGREDVAFLLTQETGGSGTFFYVVAALNTETGYVGSQAFLLGDRIAPQTIESGPGNTIVVNYADRQPGEPMTARPSVGKSARLILDAEAMQLKDINDQTIGGQTDEHGCLIAAGYSWCEARQACERSWEQYCTATQPKTVTFQCADDRTIQASFYIGDDKYVDLVLSDGRKLSVPRALSASGARYAKADESFVFWNKGDTAFITEAGGGETYKNCILK
ncbi:hypothetical protein C4552_03505 [Candidatus Parcubacteria bacterium]|nr:MAG: hypothetical protein C4552_03505 [Candidatus Parcubacteria bacterium]